MAEQESNFHHRTRLFWGLFTIRNNPIKVGRIYPFSDEWTADQGDGSSRTRTHTLIYKVKETDLIEVYEHDNQYRADHTGTICADDVNKHKISLTPYPIVEDLGKIVGYENIIVYKAPK